MRNENYVIENYRDQIKQLEKDLDQAEQNKDMFNRLWLKWADEHMDIEKAIKRLREQMKRHPQ